MDLVEPVQNFLEERAESMSHVDPRKPVPVCLNSGAAGGFVPVVPAGGEEQQDAPQRRQSLGSDPLDHLQQLRMKGNRVAVAPDGYFALLEPVPIGPGMRGKILAGVLLNLSHRLLSSICRTALRLPRTQCSGRTTSCVPSG